MAIEFNDNAKIKAPKIWDDRYSINGVTPYVDVAEANATIPLSYRALGLTVMIGNVEYWYKDGITDLDLVVKSGGSGLTIQQDGVDLPVQPKLNVKGTALKATDNNPNTATDLEFTGEVCEIKLSNGVTIGAPFSFVHTSNGTEVDVIDTNLAITRQSSRPIFNPLLELQYYYDLSPEGTLWNADGWGTLQNLPLRTYQDLANCLNYNIGNSIVNAELVMWDTINNKYYKFDFTSWGGAPAVVPATFYLDTTNPPADATIVTIGDNGNVINTYVYSLANNDWTIVRTGQVFTNLSDAIANDDFSVVYLSALDPTYIQANAQVEGLSGNSIVTTVSPAQVGFAFASPTMTGGSGGNGSFAYTRWLVTQDLNCSGKIIFGDLTEIDSAPIDNKNIILVDDVFGDNGSAVPYNMFKPYKTIGRAQEVAKSGDLIYVNPSPNEYSTNNNLYYNSKALNYYISSGAFVNFAGFNSLTFNRLLIRYGSIAGGQFQIGNAITIDGCVIGSVKEIIFADLLGGFGTLEISCGNYPITPNFTFGMAMSSGLVTATYVQGTTTSDPENNLTISGGGSLRLAGLFFAGDYSGNLTIDVNNFYLDGTFNYGQSSYGQVNVKCNKQFLNAIYYFDNASFNYGGIGLITYTTKVGGAFPRGSQINNGLGVTAFVLQDDNGGYISIYNIQGGNFSAGDTIQNGGGTITAQVVTSYLTTTPIQFNWDAKEVINNTIIIGVFPSGVACNWDIGTYRKTTIESTVTHQIFFYGGLAPQFDVVSNIHFDDFLLNASTTNYMQSIFYMATGVNLKGKYFFTGYYNVTGGTPASGQTSSLILLTGNTIQTIEFNGVATLKNMGFINEISNYIPNYTYSRVTARGSVSIDNSAINYYWGLILSGILISNSKLKMYADLIYDAPINFAILLGSYTSNETKTVEVDLIDCQIVNKNPACLLPVIGVGFFGGSGVLPPLTLPSRVGLTITYLLGALPDFVIGDTVSNGLGATGVIQLNPTGTTMLISTIVGQFNVGDTITGSISGASATVQAVQYYGTLRLKNAVVVGNTEIQNSIEGAWQGQPYQVYTGYSNKPQLNMSSPIAGTTYIVDSDINSNNF